MLFDLRGRGRRNVIKVVYLFLALLLGGGLVLFGIGGNTGDGGLVDAFTGSNGEPIGAAAYRDDITDARQRLEANNRDEAAWVDLIRAQTSLANTEEGIDSETGALTEEGISTLEEAAVSWESYQDIDPTDTAEESRIASVMSRAYFTLQDPEGLVSTLEVVAEDREAVGPYSQLAEAAYAAGQTRKGDLAAAKALELAEPDERKSLKQQLDAAKAQTAPAPSVTPAPSATATATPKSENSGGGGGKGKGKKSGKNKQSDK